MSAPVLYECHSHVAILTLNRPEIRNVLTDADMIEAFIGACHRVALDPAIRVMILSVQIPMIAAVNGSAYGVHWPVRRSAHVCCGLVIKQHAKRSALPNTTGRAVR